MWRPIPYANFQPDASLSALTYLAQIQIAWVYINKDLRS